jgi:hypothetical protein
VYDFIDIGGDLSTNDCTYESHQAVRLAQVSAPNSLHHDEKRVVDLVVQFLGAELAAQVVPNTTSKEPVKIFQSGLIAALDSRHELMPVNVAGNRRRRL